jgi:GMP synthase (glutamine-hydrolysing)
MMRLYILKVGTASPGFSDRFGDYHIPTLDALGPVQVDTCVLDVEHGAALPAVRDCAGVVMTGSPLMVTDDLPWSITLEKWIPSLLEARVPLLGICYGHQLIARAAGGRVAHHPGGKELGTVAVNLLADCVGDPLLGPMLSPFLAHVSHTQTVLDLPPGAVRLASNAFEPNHAFRLGDYAWGLQFHPEFTADITRFLVEKDAAKLESIGVDAKAVWQAVEETPIAAMTMRRFAAIVEDRDAERDGTELGRGLLCGSHVPRPGRYRNGKRRGPAASEAVP